MRMQVEAMHMEKETVQRRHEAFIQEIIAAASEGLPDLQSQLTVVSS